MLCCTMPFVILMHECSPGEPLDTYKACIFKHNAEPSGVYQPRRVGMMLECSNGEVLARAAFMHHHDDKGLNALHHYAALKWL